MCVCVCVYVYVCGWVYLRNTRTTFVMHDLKINSLEKSSHSNYNPEI